MARLLAVAVAVVALLPAAAHAEPAPFGHTCTPANGVRFCPTPDLASRPASFDGKPIDVDVTLPATGDGPFPTILLLHGLGQTKAAVESTNPALRYTNWFFAKQGFAVVTPTARGFGNSCGPSNSSSPGCDHGWTRLGDMRYEVRDVQTLAGLLVDEGIVKPDAIGATGISYGGGFSTMLAFLRDRVRLPDGSYAPWMSPNGTPISLTAAWPRWQWSNGESIFTRNGRGPWSRTPTGVTAQAYAGLIFAVAFGGNVAPTGGDISTDIRLWKQQLGAGTLGPGVQPTLDNAFGFHGVAGVAAPTGGVAPLLIQQGWTDGLFPAGQALGAYNALRKRDSKAPVALPLSDAGHGPGLNQPADGASSESQGLAFCDAWVKCSGGAKPAPGSVTAYTMVCPATKPAGGGPVQAASFNGLARGLLGFGTSAKLRIDSKGGNKALATAVSGAAGPGALCTPLKPDTKNKATFRTTSPGVTLIGHPRLTGNVVTKGRYGQLDARLWDLDRKSAKQRLITRGAYRLRDNQKGKFKFRLDGNDWKFAKVHRIVVVLLGRVAPTFGVSPTWFSASLTKLKISLPVR